MSKDNRLISRIIETKDVRWQDFAYLQADEFKDFSPDEEQKLRNSISTNQFTDPFKVWLDTSTGITYCLDGKHRGIILRKLITEGIEVPEMLPATFITCDNMHEAARLVLQYSSSYARTTQAGLMGFLDTYRLNIEDVMLDINIPEIDMKVLFGELKTDFSGSNEELNLEQFKDEVILKLTYSREEYIAVKQRLTVLMGEHNVSTPEELIKILLLPVMLINEPGQMIENSQYTETIKKRIQS